MTVPDTTNSDKDLRVQSPVDGTAEDTVFSGADAAASEGEKKEDTEASQTASGTARPTREELENKYRQDPRFAMLFAEKKKEPTRHYPRLGGIRLTPKRIAILSSLLLVILGCLGACVFFLVKDLDRSFESSRALAMYEAGDYEAARVKLIRVLNRDPHKESALKALADIYYRFGDWGNETFFRQRLMRLNPLKQEYEDAYMDSAMRSRNYNVIYSLLNLKVLDDEDLDPDTGALFLISALFSNHVSNGKSFYQSHQYTSRNYFSGTERGRFAEALLKAERMEPAPAEKLFAALDDIKDPTVRFEILSMRAHLLSRLPGDENDEKIDAMLEECAKLNNYAGAPLLANRHFLKYRFKDALRVSEDYLKDKMNVVMPILYAESCVLSGQPELIGPMKDRIRAIGGRQSLIIANYLEALEAFSDGDVTTAKARLQASGGTIETPLSVLLGLLIAVRERSTAEIRLALNKIMTMSPFLDLRERARTAVLGYLLNEIEKADGMPDPRMLSEYAAIATLIRLPGDDNSFLQRIILLDNYNRNLLNEEELQAALDVFPDDPVLLQIAAEFSLLRRKPERTMEYIDRYRAVSGSTTGTMAVLHMLALDQLGQHDEAEAEFRSIVDGDPDNGDLMYYYYTYCSEHGYLDSMRELAKRIDALPRDSALREFLPFIRAEIQFAEGDRKAALDIFESAATTRPDLIVHAGDLLADGDRPDAAIKRYLSVQANAPDKVQLHLKLSRLYREKNDMEAAMAQARAAWLEDREDLDARFAYARFLVDAKDYAEAVSVLKFPQYKAQFPEEVLELWYKAMLEQIKADYANGRYTPAMEGAKHLLIYFPDDKIVPEYIEKIEDLRQQERAATSPKNAKQ